MENIETLIYMFNDCQNLEYINLQNSKSNAIKTGLFDNTVKNLVLCVEYDFFKEYITDCNIIDCSENWRENRKKINLENDSCTNDCNLVNYKYEHQFKCYNACPTGTWANNFQCEDCHPDCKACDGPAYIINTNCKSCLSPDKYLQFGNCVSNCRNGYYIDENDSSIKICKCELDKCFKCSEESLSMNLCISCNDNYYPKSDELINNNNTYINCYNHVEGYYLDNNDLIYKPCYYSCKSCDKKGNEMEHNCLECKNNYNISMNLNGSSYMNCYNECNYNYYLNGSDYYICTQNGNCLVKYNELFEEKDIYIREYETDDIYIDEYNKFCFIDYQSFTKEARVSIFSNCLIWNNVERINEEGNIIYQITTYKNQLLALKNNSFNNNNLSIIDLNECEDILKQQYNLDNIELLIMIKQENKANIASKKNVKFKLYESCSKTELNLSLCGDNKINIYTKVELSEKSKQLYEQLKDLGYNMFDINDKFYQDICTPYTTEENTDIILSDRINYIYNNNDTKCQANCEYYKYYVVEEYIYCTCIVKEATAENNEENIFDENNILFEVLKYSNYKILKCYNLILTKNILKRNIGSIILFILFLIYLISFLTYIFQGIDPLKIKFFRSSINNNNNKNVNIPGIKINFFVENKFLVNMGGNLNNNNNNKKEKNKKNKNISNPPRKSSYNLNSHSFLRDLNEDKNKINKNKKYKNKRRNKYSYSSKISRNQSIKGKDSISKINSKENKAYNGTKEFDTFELNELKYEEAIIYDKRSFLQMYFDTLKREHIILFTFFVCNDFNLFCIKLIKFIFLTSSDMAMNVFFFSDESMHKIYLNYGKYDFVNQLSQIIYSTFVSQIIEIILCFLGLTDKHLYNIKKLIKSKNSKDKIKILKTFQCIKIKLAFFIFFTFLFFTFFWYAVSCFCSVYENTQIIFIKDCLFSLMFNLLYPFIIYLFPASLRICAIKDKKGRLGCVYQLSDIIPCF